MGKAAVAKAYDDINAALAVLNAEVDGCDSEPFSYADPLAGLADGCLDILAGARAAEAGFAGLKARAAVKYADSAVAIAPPDAPVQAQEMAIAAEIGTLLALGPRAAGSFLAASHALAKELPLTLSALQAGTISWQHALVMVEETASLDPAGAAALEAQFLDPNTPRPAAAAPIGEMPASRFRHNARTWRERHHAEPIEKRHAKGVADRRVEYRPDQDGMAWLSAYLPADEATAVWNKLTADARELQGPAETRTLTQLRADLYGSCLLGGTTTGDHHGNGSDTGTAAGPSSSIRPQVLVTVPVFSLMGLTDEPAMLDGYGLIPPSMARKLIADGAGSFHRVLVDPRDGRRWKSAAPNTGSARRCGTGSACGTANAPSLAAITLPSTTKPTTSSLGTTAAPQGYQTSDSPAQNTTNSVTPAAGNPPQRPKPNHPAGSHPPAGSTKANTRTGNHPTGRTNCSRRPGILHESTWILFASVYPSQKTASSGTCLPAVDEPSSKPAPASGAGFGLPNSRDPRRVAICAASDWTL